MEIQLIDDTIKITGQIKSMEDYKAIKIHLNELLQKGIKEISLDIKDSISLPSSVIGFLLKIVHQDKVKVNIKTNCNHLIEILNDLNLTNSFNIIKGE